MSKLYGWSKLIELNEREGEKLAERSSEKEIKSDRRQQESMEQQSKSQESACEQYIFASKATQSSRDIFLSCMNALCTLVGCKLIKSSQKSSINTIRIREMLENNRLLNSLRFALMRLFTALFSTSQLCAHVGIYVQYIFFCIKNSVNLVIIVSTFSSRARAALFTGTMRI